MRKIFVRVICMVTINSETACTAFQGQCLLAQGRLHDVAMAVHAAGASLPILVFDDASGAVIDLDLRGSAEDVAARLPQPAARGRGRPKLGVIPREVTLLPQHWDWLARQPGGASAALRRMIDQARRADAGRTEARAAREAAWRFLHAMAGDLPGFEEACRALFAGDRDAFRARTAAWPADVRAHGETMAWPAA
jgi:hypothetical protein